MPEETLPPARREVRDVPPKMIWGGFLTLIGSIALIIGIVMLMFTRYPLDRRLPWPLPRFAGPQLQVSPPADMNSFRAAELKRLNSAGWVDRAHGVVHIPVAEAMREIAARGIPGWPK